jgi:predicted aspartyl protease
MVEIEGMINQKPVSILIDPGASLSYISPTIVEYCKLNKIKHNKSWLVQLATGTKRKVVELVKECIVIMDGMETKVDLNILPLGSYDLLIGMDWLEKHSTVVNCRDKTFNCFDESSKGKTIKGIPRGVSVRYISSL